MMEVQVRESVLPTSPVVSRVGGTTTGWKRSPHLLTTEREIRQAVDECLRYPWFVVDVESLETPTSKSTGNPNPRTNDVMWVGLGVPGQVFLIPCGHPHGRVIEPRHKIKTPAFTLYGPDDPRSYTKTGKISMRGIEHWVEATFEPPPPQLQPYELMPLLEPLLYSDRAKIGHNVKFDLKSLGKYFPTLPPGPYHDTIVLRHVLDENLKDSRSNGYGLKELTEMWFGELPYANPDIGKNPELYGCDEVARYLAMDVRYCQLMWQLHIRKLERYDLEEAYAFEMELYPILMQMEFDGISIDMSKRQEVADDLHAKILFVEVEVYHIVGDQFPLSNTNAKRWIMFGEGTPQWGVSKRMLKTQNLSPLSYTEKTGTAQLNQAVLEYYAEHGNRLAELLLEWSTLEKLRGTFVDGMDKFLVYQSELPTLHTSYKQHGTVTGRLSSAQPNLQQLPREE
jgi:DNA polymerase I-like protein with 3'-5' exonuclease and polymerase domains